ncbi:MAG TPA: hypothetical protein VK452_06380 [Dissulfurispiraceae bacterium]|nr:hypothetical protein [Dissulfurispiraceae bacterium]
MKILLLSAALLALICLVPVPTMAGVSVGVGIALPPPIVVPAPPAVVLLPDAPSVYIAPDAGVDLFFWNGWWWRPWGGHWYRSRYYDRGWGYYPGVPRFYGRVNPGWRGYYRSHNWNGRPWNYHPIPHDEFVHGHHRHYRY